jgi:L-rhamnose-H+ transport protein
LLYSIVGLLVVPWVLALSTVPDLMSVYQSTTLRTLLVTALFGFCWGVGNVLFGEAVAIVGVALTFAIVAGLCAAVGSLTPLIMLRPERLTEASGLIVLLGVAMIVAGVSILGKAGRTREKLLGKHGKSGSVVLGISLCVASGLLGSMLNFSLAFGSGIADEAVKHGAKSSSGAHAIWAIAFLGGCLSNAGYAIMKLTRNRTWGRFGEGSISRSTLLGSAMGVLFTAGFVLYGQGATLLGGAGSGGRLAGFSGHDDYGFERCWSYLRRVARWRTALRETEPCRPGDSGHCDRCVKHRKSIVMEPVKASSVIHTSLDSTVSG